MDPLPEDTAPCTDKEIEPERILFYCRLWIPSLQAQYHVEIRKNMARMDPILRGLLAAVDPLTCRHSTMQSY